MKSEWEGRDDWFFSLFTNPKAGAPEPKAESRKKDRAANPASEDDEAISIFGPLEAVVSDTPERLLPLIARFVGHPNRAAHDEAVNCLVNLSTDKTRKDALRLLLPSFLLNPATGSVEAVRNELRPLAEHAQHPPQPTGRPPEF